MSRVEVVLFNAVGDELREVGRLDIESDRQYEVNDLVEHPDDADLWLVCSVETSEPPYTKRVGWMYVGRPDSEPRPA